MAAHITACGKVMKFGTLIEDSLKSLHSKFRVSNSILLAPPTLGLSGNCPKFHVYANNF